MTRTHPPRDSAPRRIPPPLPHQKQTLPKKNHQFYTDRLLITPQPPTPSPRLLAWWYFTSQMPYNTRIPWSLVASCLWRCAVALMHQGAPIVAVYAAAQSRDWARDRAIWVHSPLKCRTFSLVVAAYDGAQLHCCARAPLSPLVHSINSNKPPNRALKPPFFNARFGGLFEFLE